MVKRTNANRGHLILRVALLLALALVAASAEYHRDYIPISQMVADAREGKVVRLIFEADSDAVGVCYDQRCLNEKVTMVYPGGPLRGYMSVAGVTEEHMPRIEFSSR